MDLLSFPRDFPSAKHYNLMCGRLLVGSDLTCLVQATLEVKNGTLLHRTAESVRSLSSNHTERRTCQIMHELFFKQPYAGNQIDFYFVQFVSSIS